MFESNTFNAAVITITKDMADALLAQNTHNRKVSIANLNRVKHALERGEWKRNGEAIKIAKDGRILDGQHRLQAISETGIPMETLLITGLDAETQETMDTGKSRSMQDALALRGYQNAVSLAATIAGVVRADAYGLRSVVQTGGAYPVTNAEAFARIEREPELEDIAREGKKLGRIGLPGRIASVLIYTFSKIDEEDAAYFFEKLNSGEGMERGNPILTLRKSLLASKDVKGEKSPVWLMAITIKAWNKFREGDVNVSLYRFVTGGANPEKFPEPR